MRPYYDADGITIYHGDCREVLPTLEAESVTLLWTDPPYGCANADGDLLSRRGAAVGDGIASRMVPIANDDSDAMQLVVDAALRLSVPLLRSDCCCCCCCCSGGGGPAPRFAWMANRMDQHGLKFFHAIVWDKVNPGMGWRFRRQYEMVMVAHRTTGRLSWSRSDRAVANLVRQSKPRSGWHPNEKPIELPKMFIEWTSAPDDLVLDPFMGSGTTLRAAKDLARRAIGIEIEERYCEIAAKRLEQGVLAL